MLSSFWGEVYFRVSRHLGTGVVSVIRRKFCVEVRVLILAYARELRQEIREAEELEEQRRKNLQG